MTPQEMQSALECIIYAADEPATLDQLAKALGAEKTEVRAALDLLVASYQTDDRGIEIRKVAGGWKFYTKPQHHDVVRRFIKSLQPPIRLTMPALETLAVIAYKQPATVPEINEIRGVNVGGVIKTLLEKRLITTAGRKEVIGRPILYRTSKQFLMRFGLSDLEELPSLKEFEQLAQAALGSDAGIAPTEPEGGIAPDTASSSAPSEANPDGSVAAGESTSSPGADVITDTLAEGFVASGFDPASHRAVEAVANAHERSVESETNDISGEQSAESEEGIDSDPTRAKGTSA
jgi:segregation and condensation protein B